MTVRIGTSGWSYDHWTGVLYPPGLPSAERLARYCAEFSTVELNGSFYHWPGEEAFARYREALPEGTTMAVKAPRGLTHAKRLKDPDVWSGRIKDCWHELRGRREALLVQLRPDQQRDDARLEYFLSSLPAWVPVAMELRHPSWDHEDVYALLERHNAQYVVMSGAHLACILRATARTVYVRLHGPDEQHLYAGSYSDDALRWWADRIREWQGGGHDVVAYFNNDGEGHAVRNARTLRDLLA